MNNKMQNESAEKYLGKYINFQMFEDSPEVYLYVKEQSEDYFCGVMNIVLTGDGFFISRDEFSFKLNRWPLILDSGRIDDNTEHPYHKFTEITKEEFFSKLEKQFKNILELKNGCTEE